MKKAINLQAQVQLADPNSQAQFQNDLENAFAQANPGLTLTVKSLTPPDAKGKAKLRVYIEGEQDPAADFSKLTTTALQQAINSLTSKPATSSATNPSTATVTTTTTSTPANTVKTNLSPRPGSGVSTKIQEVENDDENEGVVLPPKNLASSS